MPKLSADVARVAEQEAEKSDNREALPSGVYVGRLMEVEVSEKAGQSGHHYWSWKFEVQDDAYKGRQLRLITSLSPGARFALGGAFAAFGAPADTDTDELLGKLALVKTSKVPKRDDPEEMTNRVSYIMPYEGSSADPSSAIDEDF